MLDESKYLSVTLMRLVTNALDGTKVIGVLVALEYD